MAEMIVRGADNPGAALTDLYTVGGAADVREVELTLIVSNSGTVDRSFRLARSPLGAAIAAKHYRAYDTPIPAGEQLIFNFVGLSTDVFRVYGSHADVVFQYDGIERERTVLP